MLVCNVSLRPPRRAITADIAEVLTATDATATGNIVFATLVDDPASVADLVDAYLGEIMLEAASADSTQDADVPAVYAVDVVEAASAVDEQSAAGVYTPASIPGLVGWWDASITASMSLTGSDINSITDQSGAGNTMSWAGAFSHPTYSATGFNTSYPAMIFNLSALHTGAGSTFALGTGNTLTLWFVTTMGDTPTMSYGRYFSYASSGTDFNTPTGFMFARNSTTPTQCSFYRNSAPVASSSVTAHPAPHRLIATVSAAGAITIYIDGVSVGTGTSGGNWASPGRLLIGCGQTTGDFWYGPIAECGIATSYSDATAVANLDAYLQTKWGL